jgi:membrane protease YdiL (CAAX protease family)
MIAQRVQRPIVLESIAVLTFLLALGLVMINWIPFWNGMAALMGVGAVVCALRLHAAEQLIFAPTLTDTALGLALAGISWGMVRLLWLPLMKVIPGFAGGLVLVGGYAAGEPLIWAAISMVIIAVSEEIVWRRYLIWRLADWRAIGTFRSATLCAFVYAGMHLWSGQVFLAAPALAFGLIWGWLSAWRGGPWASITWHVGFDILVFLIAPPPMQLPPGI